MAQVGELYAVTVGGHSLYNFTSQGLHTINKSFAILAAEGLHRVKYTDSVITVWEQVSDVQWKAIGHWEKGHWQAMMP